MSLRRSLMKRNKSHRLTTQVSHSSLNPSKTRETLHALIFPNKQMMIFPKDRKGSLR